VSDRSELERIAAEIGVCTLCALHRGRTNAVPGVGLANAEIMFIGEAPGFHEDQQALPFVGAAGRFLDQLLEGIGLSREQVYITNVIKCRPPANRDPLLEEIEACRPFLDRQIAAIAPRMVVTLGRFSMARYFPGTRISQIHGQPRRIARMICYPMYHPAAALHQPSLRSVVEEDMQRIPELLADATQITEYEPPTEAEQLRLF
jgi:uracil-DNA glycosylase family 4